MKGLLCVAIMLFISNFAWTQKVNIPTTKPSVIGINSAVPKQLPIFKLLKPIVNEGTVQQIAQSTFGKVGKIFFVNNKYVTEIDNQVVEIDLNGNIWAADRNQLWNPKLDFILPADAVALNTSSNYLNAQGLLKKQTGVTTRFSHFGSTQAVILERRTGKRTNKKLDTQVIYNSYVDANPAYAAPELPIVDGSGEMTVTFGNNNRIIGFNSSLLNITGISQVGSLIPPEEIENQFIKSNAKFPVSDVKLTLGYAAMSRDGARDFLYPVYRISSNITVNGIKTPQRLVTLPATAFSMLNNVVPKINYRDSKTLPRPGSLLKEGLNEVGSKINFKSPLLYDYVPIKPTSPPNASDLDAFECATSWVADGIPLSGTNATGFTNGLARRGWAVNFNWGAENCWESDWRKDANNWVDATDFVFYSGHASPSDWVFKAPDDGSIHASEINASANLWGKGDLEWVVIAACGPLQDNIIARGGGSVLDRWQWAFNGLHQFLGYAAVTGDTDREGGLLAQYCWEGHTIIDAWFRTAREIQPSRNDEEAPNGPIIWSGVMYGYSSEASDPLFDHIWGRGSVAADTPFPEFLVALFTTT